MPERVLRPGPVIWAEYALLIGSGAFFEFSADAESVRAVLGTAGSHLTSLFLFVGGIIGLASSLRHRYVLELAAYPFLVAPWVVYAIAIFVRAIDGQGLVGFAFLLGAGAMSLVGRGTELWHTIKIHKELDQRERDRLFGAGGRRI